MQPREKTLGFFLAVSLDDDDDDEDVGKRKKEDMADLEMRLGLGIRGSSAEANGGRFLGRCLIC